MYQTSVAKIFLHHISCPSNSQGAILLQSRLASTKHLPPTVSLQWRPMPNSTFQPYFGLGINYTNFFDEKTYGLLEGTKLSLDDSWGYAIQGGFDVVLSDNVFFNVDVRYANIESKAELDGASLGTVKIDPVVYGAHIGFRF